MICEYNGAEQGLTIQTGKATRLPWIIHRRDRCNALPIRNGTIARATLLAWQRYTRGGVIINSWGKQLHTTGEECSYHGLPICCVSQRRSSDRDLTNLRRLLGLWTSSSRLSSSSSSPYWRPSRFSPHR